MAAEPVDFIIGGGNIGRIVFRIPENHIGIIVNAACRPSVRIRFGENHLTVLVAVLCNDIQAQLHLMHQAFHGRNRFRRMHFKREAAPLHMESNKIQPRSLFLGAEIRPIPAVIQEKTEKFLRMAAFENTGHSRSGKP